MTKLASDYALLHESALYAYNAGVWRPVLCDASGNLLTSLAGGGALTVEQSDQTKLKATAYIADAQTIAVEQSDQTKLKATVTLAAAQTITVTQTAYANLKASVVNTPRIPPGVTNLSNRFQATSLPSNNWAELFSNTTGATLGNCSGRTVASGKKLCIAYLMAYAAIATGYVYVFIGYDNTPVFQNVRAFPAVETVFPVMYECVGDGSKVWKIGCINGDSVARTTTVSALVWEESV